MKYGNFDYVIIRREKKNGINSKRNFEIDESILRGIFILLEAEKYRCIGRHREIGRL